MRVDCINEFLQALSAGYDLSAAAERATRHSRARADGKLPDDACVVVPKNVAIAVSSEWDDGAVAHGSDGKREVIEILYEREEKRG